MCSKLVFSHYSCWNWGINLAKAKLRIKTIILAETNNGDDSKKLDHKDVVFRLKNM